MRRYAFPVIRFIRTPKFANFVPRKTRAFRILFDTRTERIGTRAHFKRRILTHRHRSFSRGDVFFLSFFPVFIFFFVHNAPHVIGNSLLSPIVIAGARAGTASRQE